MCEFPIIDAWNNLAFQLGHWKFPLALGFYHWHITSLPGYWLGVIPLASGSCPCISGTVYLASYIWPPVPGALYLTPGPGVNLYMSSVGKTVYMNFL